MSDNERNEDYGDVKTNIKIHTSGHQIGQRNRWDVLLALMIILTFLVALAMVLVFGVIVLQMFGDMIAWIVRAL